MTNAQRAAAQELIEAVYDYLAWSNGDPCKDTDGLLAQIKRRERRMQKAAEDLERETQVPGTKE